jgi:hypothetical protein
MGVRLAKNGPAGGDQYQSPGVDFEESTAELASSPTPQDLKFDPNSVGLWCRPRALHHSSTQASMKLPFTIRQKLAVGCNGGAFQPVGYWPPTR